MKISNIPRSMIILGNKWKIQLHKKDIVYEGKTVEGLCSKADRTIQIRVRDATTTYETFFHELGHAMMYELSLDQTKLSSDLEEIIVDAYSRLLVKHFKINFK